jgi:methylenetetrahydrofolate--tRNA-(uracil-5-)-methyltransferase
MTPTKGELTVIGGGLAGSEAAWQAANRGIRVDLFEMRPLISTGAHQTDKLAELVCSNSLGSDMENRASGVLKRELRMLNSLLIRIADETALPAGGALAVDRLAFSSMVSEKIASHPNINLIRDEVITFPQTPTIIASGPLTSDKLSKEIALFTGIEHLYFYDAIAPLIYAESIDMKIAFRASRYGKGALVEGDYINCPLNQEEYESFVKSLIKAERINLLNFEQNIEMGVEAGASHYFEGCLPVEVLASRGERTLSFGPMRPVGIFHPVTGKRPYAVIQLRQDNLAGSLYNMVGFQTNLKFPEQRRIFRRIPGLEKAEFARYGQMHRNTFISSPVIIRENLQAIRRPDLFFAGQITGVEGYVGNIATGLLAGINASLMIKGQELITFPKTTILGSLCYYISHANLVDFQPMKANFGLLPPIVNDTDVKLSKKERYMKYAQRALDEIGKISKDIGNIN